MAIDNHTILILGGCGGPNLVSKESAKRMTTNRVLYFYACATYFIKESYFYVNESGELRN